MPSPMSMHMPSIATKSSNLLATILPSMNFPSLLFFSIPSSMIVCERLDFADLASARLVSRIPIFIFLQSSEYNANVPPEREQFQDKRGHVLRIR